MALPQRGVRELDAARQMRTRVKPTQRAAEDAFRGILGRRVIKGDVPVRTDRIPVSEDTKEAILLAVKYAKGDSTADALRRVCLSDDGRIYASNGSSLFAAEVGVSAPEGWPVSMDSLLVPQLDKGRVWAIYVRHFTVWYPDAKCSEDFMASVLTDGVRAVSFCSLKVFGVNYAGILHVAGGAMRAFRIGNGREVASLVRTLVDCKNADSSVVFRAVAGKEKIALYMAAGSCSLTIGEKMPFEFLVRFKAKALVEVLGQGFTTVAIPEKDGVVCRFLNPDKPKHTAVVYGVVEQ